MNLPIDIVAGVSMPFGFGVSMPFGFGVLFAVRNNEYVKEKFKTFTLPTLKRIKEGEFNEIDPYKFTHDETDLDSSKIKFTTNDTHFFQSFCVYIAWFNEELGKLELSSRR